MRTVCHPLLFKQSHHLELHRLKSEAVFCKGLKSLEEIILVVLKGEQREELPPAGMSSLAACSPEWL